MISLDSIRQQLASPKLSWQLCLLAVIGGFSASMLIVLFTYTIHSIQSLYLITYDNYTSLDSISRFDLPIIGALIILCFSWFTGYKYNRTGIPFVLHRLKVAYGDLPFQNTLHQFFGGIISLSTGFSVGKEGPVVHLGAAASSFVGAKLKLPNNCIRTLCGCGIAAGISASFNTPIAAVIFVMEVILREYDIQIFIPIMLASIIGSVVTNNIFGSSHDYEFIGQIILNYNDFLILILLGVLLGTLAAAFNNLITITIKRFANLHIFTRLLIASLITGSLGILAPYAMGTGSSAVMFSVNHADQMPYLFSLLSAKFLMTVFVIGLGMPGGIIGPIIGIGAVTGVLGSLLLAHIIPGTYVSSDFALIGMAGFMAATLNAPLAALLAVVELSNQMAIMLPAMIVITSACLISGQLFNNRSVFTMQLDVQKLLYRKPPIETALQKVGVLSQMKQNFVLLDEKTSANESPLFNSEPFVIKQDKQQGKNNYYLLEPNSKLTSANQSIYCHHQLIVLDSQATLAEAYLLLLPQRNGGVYIVDDRSKDIKGLITFDQIINFLLKEELA